MTYLIEQGFVVKTDRIGDQCISLPPANRVPHPEGAQILVMWAPIRVDSAHKVIELEEHDHLARNLSDLHWKVEKINPWHTGRKAVENWILQYIVRAGPAIYGIGGLKFRLCPRRHRGDHLAKINVN